jgi:hypothetical protein
MNNKTNTILYLLTVLFLSLFLQSCKIPGAAYGKENIPGENTGSIHTQAAETVQNWMTMTSAAAHTEITTTATITPTPKPTNTPTPQNTPKPSASPTTTKTPNLPPSDWVQFIDDVTVEDNTVFLPGVEFTKIWRLKNSGSGTWTEDYHLVFFSGDNLGANTFVDLPYVVAPGQTVDIPVKMVSPVQTGTYTSRWKLRNRDGDLFGAGTNANSPIWVKIKVVEMNGTFPSDLALGYCTANWSSQTGILPCPGDDNNTNGFIRLLENPALENRHENEPALWMKPNKGDGGWISGINPPFLVSKYDHFLAWVG